MFCHPVCGAWGQTREFEQLQGGEFGLTGIVRRGPGMAAHGVGGGGVKPEREKAAREFAFFFFSFLFVKNKRGGGTGTATVRLI